MLCVHIPFESSFAFSMFFFYSRKKSGRQFQVMSLFIGALFLLLQFLQFLCQRFAEEPTISRAERIKESIDSLVTLPIFNVSYVIAVPDDLESLP
ncbi:hypothetical protein V5799_029905 [Amblyomma americanum]|uniref:Uncharacterized protein n=1 Tax=Amblyomma americanum TaxID=6943 RepID=A0AAQ4EPY9_AMBAM